jgi:hypothetical protein
LGVLLFSPGGAPAVGESTRKEMMSRYNTLWNGKMALSNVVCYLARALDVPVAAIDLKLKWPHPKGQLRTFSDKELVERQLKELRLLWNR